MQRIVCFLSRLDFQGSQRRPFCKKETCELILSRGHRFLTYSSHAISDYFSVILTSSFMDCVVSMWHLGLQKKKKKIVENLVKVIEVSHIMSAGFSCRANRPKTQCIYLSLFRLLCQSIP